MTFGFSDGKVRINDASIQTADVMASNGVIHVIDSVLIPRQDVPRQDVPRRDIYSWTWNQMRYKTLRALINAAGYQDLIGGRNDFTIFAPNDAAFDTLPSGTVDSLLKPENKEKARAILAQHIVMGRVSTGDAMNAGSMKALNGGNLKFDIAQGLFQVNGATVISTDLKRDNGVIHVIDKVLLPSEVDKKTDKEICPPAGQTVSAGDKKDIVETAVGAGSFKTLAAALGAAGLVDTLKGNGPFTVFAPTDAAFAKLPAGTVEELLKPENKEKLQAILKFHVIPGQIALSDALKAGKANTVLGQPVNIGFSDGKVRINDTSIQTADVKASNGVIHVIDSVLLPTTPKQDIYSVLKRDGNFNTLLAAFDACKSDEMILSKSEITLFAPTDAAFKALPKGTVERMFRDNSRDSRWYLLAQHVVKGKVPAGDAMKAQTVKAVYGEDLKSSVREGVFEVNGATIVTNEIKCDNGVVHVIDKVLLPPVNVPFANGVDR